MHIFEESFDISQVTNVMNMVLLGVFIAIVALLVISFLRGLGRGWRYGTFRFVFFGILIVAAILSLKALANSVADIDLNTFGLPQLMNMTEFSMDLQVGNETVTVSAPVTSIRETGVSVLAQALQAYNITADPDVLIGLVLAFILSLVCVILLVVEALIIWIVGGLLCTLLWHIIFKHFLHRKNEEGKRVKKLKLISAFEEVAISAAILSMFLSPFTALVNTISKTYSRIPRDENKTSIVATDQFYSVLTSVVDTYENSLFSKTFFSWYTDPNTGLTFDAALIDFITTIDVDKEGKTKLSLMREFKNVIEVAGTALNEGIFSEENMKEGFNIVPILTGNLIPTAIRAIGNSPLIKSILPFGLQFVFSFPEIAEYVMTEESIDFEHYEPAATFDQLASIWENVAQSGIIDDVVTEDGNLIEVKDLGNVFQSKNRVVFDEFFKFISPSEKRVLDDIIVSALYVEAVKEYENPGNPDEITFGAKDILPELTEEDIRRGESGYPVAIPESIRSIDFGHEMQVLFDTFYEIMTVDPEFVKYVFEYADDSIKKANSSEPTSQASSSTDPATQLGKKMIVSLLEHKDQVEHWIDGKEAEGTSSEDTCLFDSSLLLNAVPKVLKLLEAVLNEAVGPKDVSSGGMDERIIVLNEEINLDGLISEFKSKATFEAKKEAAKAETQAMFSIFTPLLNTDEGKELIENYETMPGIYFDDDGAFLGADEGLLKGVANCVRNIDDSKVLSTIISPTVTAFLSGDSSSLKALFGDDLAINTDCVDSSGKSIIGREFAKLIDVLAECQDIIGFASTLDANSSNMRALEKSFSHMCSLETANHEKQLVKLLTAFADNKILNPEVDGKKNSNFCALFKNIFNTLDMGSAELSASMDAIICDDSFDVESEVTSFVELIDYICSAGILGSVSDFTIDSMSEICFEELFSKIDGSELLGTIIGTVIDSSLADVDIFTYVNEGGQTVALSFKNITNWSTEGAALDKMTKYAAAFGDISNIDLESIDPQMMESVFEYLANSQLFIKTNEDGTYDYNFPNYISSKLIENFKSSSNLGTYFANLTETYEGGVYKVEAAEGTQNEDYSDFKARVLDHAVSGANDLDQIHIEQATFAHEGEIFGSIIRNLASSGAFNLMSDGANADLSKFKVEYFRALLCDMSDSVLFGKTGVPAVLKVVVDTLSTSVDTFKNSNIMYAYTCTDAERLEVANSIADLLAVVVDPVSGLLAADGTIDTDSFTNIENLDPNHFLSPLLKSFAGNKVFTTLSSFQTNTAGITSSAFDEQMLMVLRESGWYGSDEKAEAVYPIIKTMVENRVGGNGWDGEIDRFVEIVDDLHIMGINLSSSFDFDQYFQEARFGEDILSDLFIDINDSCLLFPGFPEKLETALDTVDSSLASSGLNLDNANLYYAGKATISGTTYDYAPVAYGEDECYNLASVIRYGSVLSGGIDVNDLTTIPEEDVDSITGLLGTFAKSHIFNSRKTLTSDTVFQEFIAKILTTNEHVENYMFDVKSPKDIANASNYSDATSKAKYLASYYYPEIAAVVDNANTLPTTNISDKTAPNSINTLLRRMIANSSLINALDHTSISDLSSIQLSDLLTDLNNCDWTFDAVPNAVAKAIGEIALDDVKLTRSNPYYGYYYDIGFDEGSGTYVKPSTMTRLLAPDFGNHYDNNEILALADSISIINQDSSALTDFSDKNSITNIRNLLDGLNESYIFSKDGPCYFLEADDSPAETKTDLSVFEQSMYKVFKDSTLADLSYSETIDGQYADSEAKLLAKVKAYPDDNWESELAAILINDTQDAGLLCTAYDLGIISGSTVSVDSNTLESLTPEEIGEILYAVNEVDMIREIIPYQASDFLANKLHFSNYSVATLSYAPNATTFEIPVTTPVNSITITYSGAAAPVVSYQKAGATYNVLPNAVSANVNEYVINDGSTYTDIVLGNMITVTCNGNMTDIELAFDTNAINGMSKAKLDTYNSVTGTHKGAINSFLGLIERLHDGSGYIDLGANPSAIADLFQTSGNLTALANFAKNGDSIYTRIYNANNQEASTGLFTGGDVVLSNLLSFEQGGTAVNLARYLPSYDSADLRTVYKDLYTIFVGENQNCLTSEEIADVAEWLDDNVLEVASLSAEYEQGKSYGMSMVANNIGIVTTLGGQTVSQFITLDAYSTWNTFEAKMKAGFCRAFYEDMKEYALACHYINGGNNLSLTDFRPDETTYRDFVYGMRDSIIFLLKNVKPSGVTNKADVVETFEDFANANALGVPFSDVLVAFYEGTIYENLKYHDSTNFNNLPTQRPTPWGANGYFQRTADIISAY